MRNPISSGFLPLLNRFAVPVVAVVFLIWQPLVLSEVATSPPSSSSEQVESAVAATAPLPGTFQVASSEEPLIRTGNLPGNTESNAPASPRESSGESFHNAVPKRASENAAPPEHEFTKYIGNQRVLFVKTIPPPLRIDLTGVYESHEGFEGCVPVTTISGPPKESVAKASIEGRMLVIEWRGIGKTNLMLRTTNPETGFFVDESIKLEVYTPDYLAMFCTLLGGLGVFLLGMKNMSEGVQSIAGERLRRMIAILTENRFSAVGVGLVTTALIQSSSATTVMVVGFINGQIMTLAQGIGVIMGANIGTTFTAWILTMKIDPLIMPLVGISACVFLFARNERVRFYAMAALGLGFIFLGMNLMQDGFKEMSEFPSFIACMQVFKANTYPGVLVCAVIGCGMTLVVQSSSATIGITISLASIGMIDFPTAAALVLGENVGTTITALLASIGTSTNARRAAYFHVIFNITGVLWVSTLFIPLQLPQFVAWIVGLDLNTESPDPAVVSRAIAMAHSLFNITNMFLFLPFVRISANLLMRLVPDRPTEDSKGRLTGLDFRMLESAPISIERSRIEVQRMGQCCDGLAATVKDIMAADITELPEIRKTADTAFDQEEMLDSLQDEIITFTSALLAGNISQNVADLARTQLKMADEIESIGDYLVIILKSTMKLQESGLVLPSPVKEEILQLHAQMQTYLAAIFQHYARRRPGSELLAIEHSQGKSINATAKSIRDRFIKRMSEEKFDPQVIIAINTQLNAYRRIREHGRNVAEAVGGTR